MCVARKLHIQLNFDGPGINQSVKFFFLFLFLMAGFHNNMFNLSNL